MITLRLVDYKLPTTSIMSSYHSSKYGSSVVVVQGSSRSSAYSASSSASRSSTYSTPSSYSRSTYSMDSSGASQPVSDEWYRSGSSCELSCSRNSTQTPMLTKYTAGFYTNVKEVPSSRGGSSVVVVHHNRTNPDKDEPRASDYQPRDTYRKK